tara:strand:- start:2966 stop:3151 length:186 start_codon:yes stop_codon:yes gene_type:complete
VLTAQGFGNCIAQSLMKVVLCQPTLQDNNIRAVDEHIIGSFLMLCQTPVQRFVVCEMPGDL